jgi:hypothetical protein
MKRDDPLSSGGSTLLILGAMAFFPPLMDFEFLLTAWLGGMQQPVGLSAMVVGGALFGLGKLRELRGAAPVVSPTDPEAIMPADGEARASGPQAAIEATERPLA